MQSVLSNRRFFYGWVVVAAAFAITFVGFGCAYSFSPFIESLQHQFKASLGAVSLVFSLAGFLYFGLGALSGPLADRFGARRLSILGMALIGLGLILASQARNITEVYLAYGLGIGLGIGCAYVPAIATVQRWFVRRRAFASGLAVSGIGVGTLVMPPVSTWLIAAFGWRGAYVALGVFAAVVGVGMSVLLVNDPRDKRTGPDGEAFGEIADAIAPWGMFVKDAIRTPQFAGLYAACLICAFGVFVPFVHLVPYAIDHRLNRASAALLLGAVGMGSTVGRFFLGGLADRLGRHCSLVFMYVGMAASLMIWVISSSFVGLAVFAILFGLFYGGWVAILPAVVIDCFGARNASGIIGVLYTSVALGTLAGPSAAGFAYDLIHSYTLPIVMSAAACMAAAVISALTIKLLRQPLPEKPLTQAAKCSGPK